MQMRYVELQWYEITWFFLLQQSKESSKKIA